MTGLNLETFLNLIRADLGLWASFAAIVVILGLMTWTSWGSRRVLRKCLVVSVVVHLGMIATGSQTVLGLRVLGLVPLATVDDPRPQERIRTIRVVPEVASSVDSGRDGTPGDGGRAPGDPRAAFDRPGDSPSGELASLAPLPTPAVPEAVERSPARMGTAPVAPPAASVPEINPPLPTDLAERADETPEPENEVADAPALAPADAVDLPEVAQAGPSTPAADPLAALRSTAAGTARPDRPTGDTVSAPQPSRDVATDAGPPPALARPSLPSSMLTAGSNLPPAGPTSRPEPSATGGAGSVRSNPVAGIPALDAPSIDLGDDLPVAAPRPEARPAPALAMPGRGDGGGGGARPALPLPSAPALTPSRPAERAPLAIARGLPTGVLAPPEIARNPLEPRRLPDVPEVYRPRLDPDRSLRAQQAGASRASEEAVEQALIWLAAHQDADGRWDAATETDSGGVPLPGGDDFTVHCPPGEVCSGACYYWEADTATTGLALLAYLGAGYTHTDGRHARTVARGLEFLRSIQAPDGDLRHRSRAVGMYCHAMAALALCEAYAMTGDPELRDPAERAVDFLLNSRAADRMSWRYAPGAPTGDTSILGWAILVLRSAEENGFEVAQPVKDGADRWLHLVASGDSGGLAGYQPGREATPPMTAEAWVCRQFLGVDKHDASSDEAARYLLANAPGRSEFNLYYWYYGTLAMYQHGGAAWDRWNAEVRDQLVGRQESSGHQAGSWDPALCEGKYDSLGGRIYSTAVAALTLEVYYRYLRFDGGASAPPRLAPKLDTPGDPTLRRAGNGPSAPAAMPFPRRR